MGAGQVLNELIFECQRSFEGIAHAKLDVDARAWARARWLSEWMRSRRVRRNSLSQLELHFSKKSLIGRESGFGWQCRLLV
jgi:hypothetical protein